MGLKNRFDLAKYLYEQSYKVGAEVGVLEGHYSEILLDNIPGLALYCVDNWKNIAYREAVERMAFARLAKRAIIMRKSSVEAAESFDDGCLDFVYIDANHQYHSIMDDLKAWTPKVRKGGIVCGDDFYDIPGSKWGVVQAVIDFTHEHGYHLQTSKWDPSLPEEDSHPQFWFIV